MHMAEPQRNLYAIQDIYNLPDGVREYWIVDPEKSRVLVYNYQEEDTLEYSFGESVKAGIYPDFWIDFARLGI